MTESGGSKLSLVASTANGAFIKAVQVQGLKLNVLVSANSDTKVKIVSINMHIGQ